MQVKVISDIHCDINSGENDTYNFLNDFVICCGDISGNRFKTEKWIKNNLKQGIIVAGNHLGYDWITNNEEDTLDNSIKYLQAFKLIPSHPASLIKIILYLSCFANFS